MIYLRKCYLAFAAASALMFSPQLSAGEKESGAFDKCLIKEINGMLKSKVPESEAVQAIVGKCTAQRDALLASIYEDEKSYGSSDEEAHTYAEEEAANTVESWMGGYAELLQNGQIIAQ